MLWKIDGEEVFVPYDSSKKDMVDLECEIEQLPVLNRKEHVKEILNKIISNIIDLSQKIKCELCQSKFSSVDSLKRHIREFHEANDKAKEDHICTICQKSFISSYKLRGHSGVHENKEKVKKSHLCTICQKSSPTPSKLEIYMKVHERTPS